MITPLQDDEMITDLQDMTTATIPHDTEIETVAVTEEIEIETVKSDTTKTPPITEVPTVTAGEIILPPPEETIVPVAAITGLPVVETILQVGEITHLVAEAQRMSIPPQENTEIIDMIIEEGVRDVLMETEAVEVDLEVDMVGEIVNGVFLQREHVVQLQI